jgi:hypothetical protein
MRGFGGCLLVIVGFVGLYLAITLSLTFFLLPVAFVLLLGCLILISYALGPSDRE